MHIKTPPELEKVKSVCKRTSQCRQTIWRKIKDGEFPAPIDIGNGRIAFVKAEVDDWINSRPRVVYIATD